MNESKSILVENTWLRSEDCEYLIVLYETFWSPDVGTDFNGDRGLYYTVFSGSTEVKQYLRALSKRLQDRIQEFFGVTGLFLEAFVLAALLRALSINVMRTTKSMLAANGFQTMCPSE